MRVEILDRNGQLLTTIDNSAPEGAFIIDDLQTYSLYEPAVFDLEIPTAHPDYRYIVNENMIRYVNKRGRKNLLTIMEVEDPRNGIVSFTAESFGFKLIKKTTVSYVANSYQPIQYYLERELAGTGIEIRLNEIPDVKRKLDFSNKNEKTSQRIGTIVREFGAEYDLDFEEHAGQISKMVIDIYDHRGSVIPVKTFYVGKTVEAISKKTSAYSLITAIKPTGSGSITISDVVYDDPEEKGIVSQQGSPFIFHQKANQERGGYKLPGQSQYGYLEEEISFDTDDPGELFNLALKRLETLSQLTVTYEIPMLEDDLDVNLGDVVRIVDEGVNPQLTIDARVVGMEESETNPLNNKWIFSNHREIENELNKGLINRQNALIGNEGLRLELSPRPFVFKPNISSQEFSVKIFEGPRDITHTFLTSEFKWRKVMADGSHDTAWEERNRNAGSKVTVELATLEQIATKQATVSIDIVRLNTTLITKTWFVDEYKSLVNRVLTYRKSDDIVLAFSTDNHFTVDATNDTHIKVKSRDHFNNLVDVAEGVNADLIIANGDTVDGNSTTKKQHISDYQSVVDILTKSKLPVAINPGNHDFNSWGDNARALGNGAQRITKAEKYNLMTKPFEKYGIKRNANEPESSYFYFDVPSKKVRFFGLDTSDLTFEITNGKPKYDFNNDFGFRKQQIDWLIASLDSVPADYQVVITSHYGLPNTYNSGAVVVNSNIVAGILKAFVNGSNVTMSTNNNPDFNVSVNHTFTKKGTIIMTAHGHFHTDRVAQIADYKAPNFSVGCSLARSDSLNRTLDTANEDLFVIFVIRQSDRTIKAFRFGAGQDYTMTY